MIKRAFDICASFVGLVLFMPLMIMVGLVIKVTSKGPVLFRQKRLTKNMREFTIYKFRSMRTDFDKEAKGIQIKGNSDAITKIGKIIRKTKIDELPQLFNIIKGDMSFVGPRPELPRRLSYYSDSQKEIFNVRSGITSTASITFSDEEQLLNRVKNPEKFYIEQIMPYKIELNKYYIENMSFKYDIILIFSTIVKIVWKIDFRKILKNQELLNKKNQIEKLIGIEY